LFNLFDIQLVKLMWSLKDDGYPNLTVRGNMSSLAAYSFAGGGLRLGLSR